MIRRKARPTVLLVESSVREIHQEQWSQALGHFNFINCDCESTEEVCERLEKGEKYYEIDAILKVEWLKAGQFAQHHIFGSTFIERYSPSLKLICCARRGHDATDVKSLTKKGVLYANTPDTCTESVTNTSLYLILDAFLYFSLVEHHIHYYNRREREDVGAVLPDGANYHADLESLLQVSACICVACPLTPDARGMVSNTQSARMKRGVKIVNIAQGGIIDEEALICTLETGIFGGVGLDVHANEPGVNPRLQERRSDTTLLPHIGVCSWTSLKNFDRVSLENLHNYFYGDPARVKAVNQPR